MSNKPDGTKGKKENKSVKYMVDNSSRNAKRQLQRVARKFGSNGKAEFTARDRRRALGDLNPVNKIASLQQAPEGRFARSLSKVEQQKILGTFVPKTKADEALLEEFGQ